MTEVKKEGIFSKIFGEKKSTCCNVQIEEIKEDEENSDKEKKSNAKQSSSCCCGPQSSKSA